MYDKFRRYDQLYELLNKAETNEIKLLTNCVKPCNYKKYDLLGHHKPTAFKSEHFTFSLWAVSKNMVVKTEQLIYPVSHLVAEIGGTLGLFLGFSFMAFWDDISNSKLAVVILKRFSFNDNRLL